MNNEAQSIQMSNAKQNYSSRQYQADAEENADSDSSGENLSQLDMSSIAFAEETQRLNLQSLNLKDELKQPYEDR